MGADDATSMAVGSLGTATFFFGVSPLSGTAGPTMMAVGGVMLFSSIAFWLKK
ncbi:MAG: hypothetical protein ABIH83_02985 [Candidatus Micrarchaeota archaeon]